MSQAGSTQGNLLPLKTLHECQLADKTWEIYVVVVPSDLGEQAVKYAQRMAYLSFLSLIFSGLSMRVFRL